MYNDIFRYHYPAQYDLPGFPHGLDLVLRDLGRIIAEQGVYGNGHPFFFPAGFHLYGVHSDGL